MAIQHNKEAPLEYSELRICREFGWTVTELESQPWDKIEMFLGMMNIESQFQAREARKVESKIKTKRRFPK